MSATEDIKARLDIIDVIGAYVQLKRSGSNFSGRCPFHSEKTPSFMVSRAKQLWYCFGACSEGGDIFKFLMKIDNLDFPEALKILADKAGVVLPHYDKQVETQRNTLLTIMREATSLYAAELNSSRGTVVQEYLRRRGLSKSVIAQFGLGYAPDSWDTLATAFKEKFKAEDIFAAGLLIRSERNQEFYDRFRHRLMFPIRDIHGNTIGFTSRLLDETRQEGKYVNTPETAIYSKGRVLYGLDAAREAIRKVDHAVIVEGNMDVIACHQFGMTNVVASSGTALTLDQIRLLKRYTNNLKIAFDADLAGEHAAKRGIDLAMTEGMRIKVIIIPPRCGKDPDECIRKDAKTWESAVRDAREIIDYYLTGAQARFDPNTASGRSQFVHLLLREILKLPDLIEQDFWLKRIADLTKVDERVLRDQLQRLTKSGTRVAESIAPLAEPRAARSTKSKREQLSERILALLLTEPAQATAIIAQVIPEMLAPERLQGLYSSLVVSYNAYNSLHGSAPSALNFRQFWRNSASNEAPEILSTVDILELFGDKEFEGWSLSQFARETAFIVHELQREYFKARRARLIEEMRSAERAGDHGRVIELTQEFNVLQARTPE